MKISDKQFESLALEQMDLLYPCGLPADARPGSGRRSASGNISSRLPRQSGFDLQSHGMRPWLIRIMHNLHTSRGERESRQPVAMEMDSLDAWGGYRRGSSLCQ